jgi:hypothetical protein
LKRGAFGKWGWGSPPAIHRPPIGNGGMEGIVESILAWKEKRHVYDFMQKLSVYASKASKRQNNTVTDVQQGKAQLIVSRYHNIKSEGL